MLGTRAGQRDFAVAIRIRWLNKDQVHRNLV
jgi:hypothetical protein